MWGITHREKMLTRYPGVLVGRGCRFAIVDAKNEPDVLRFYEHNGFKPLFPREIDEDFYTKPPKDDEEREERMKHPRKLRTRLMFSDLLDE